MHRSAGRLSVAIAVVALIATGLVVITGQLAFGAHENCHDGGARCHGMDHDGSTADNYVHPWFTRNSGTDFETEIDLRRCTGPLNGCTGWKQLTVISCGRGPHVCTHLHTTWKVDASECRAYMINEVFALWRYSHAHHYWCG